MHITEIDYFRAAIANALAEGMTLEDLWACAEHAENAEALDEAVNVLAQTQPANTP